MTRWGQRGSGAWVLSAIQGGVFAELFPMDGGRWFAIFFSWQGHPSRERVFDTLEEAKKWAQALYACGYRKETR